MSYQFKHLNKGNTVGSGSYVFRQYSEQITPQEEYFLTFSSPNSFTLSVNNSTKSWDGTLETSTDKINWNTWSGTSVVSSASDGTKHNIFVRGTGNTYITGNSATSSTCPWRLNGSNISVIGNIENLLDYATVELGNHPAMAVGCYRVLFAYPTSSPNGNITDISQLELPATTLTESCYRGMFQALSAITTLPSGFLPATTLASNCYTNMFNTCISLTSTPALPATTLASSCYSYMFYGCTSLTTAPALPATTLVNSCYSYMFYGCTSLNQIMKLRSTLLIDYCYYQMFYESGVKLYTSTDTGYSEYRIPDTGTGYNVGVNGTAYMFGPYDGIIVSHPSLNTTYYTNATVID